ncbi:hypothetical protein BC936DRAFT_143751 [Jimgerdemannia flammicorona]|uniref:Uncharacterized protein n=1 Tax=Jimgerdemannia flammicorona TaxID=994334 RepID=A0A433DMG7_9FUNG|nr:hypothetical protein BC936DRAFT_143751 [Jimgerdemannia flammicorona]
MVAYGAYSRLRYTRDGKQNCGLDSGLQNEPTTFDNPQQTSYTQNDQPRHTAPSTSRLTRVLMRNNRLEKMAERRLAANPFG